MAGVNAARIDQVPEDLQFGIACARLAGAYHVDQDGGESCQLGNGINLGLDGNYLGINVPVQQDGDKIVPPSKPPVLYVFGRLREIKGLPDQLGHGIGFDTSDTTSTIYMGKVGPDGR